MNKLFRRWLKNRTQGDEEKELFWWDLFFNYEVVIGFVIATILCLIAYLVMGVFSSFSEGFKIFDFNSILMVIGISLLVGGFFAMVIVSPLNDNENDRKENLKQGSLYFATALGHIANFIINWAPLLALVASILNFKWNVFIGCCAGVALYYILLSLVKPNAKDYVNWRFAWAIENYDSLFSGHYKWWTSAANMSLQKFHLKKFQKYKFHATLSLIMVPLLFTLLLFSGTGFVTNGNRKAHQVQVTSDSITVAPDSAENIIEDNNEEIDLLGSEGEDEIALQEESLNEDTHYDEYYEESSSQPTTSNPRAEKAESKPLKTESSSQPREHVNAAPAEPVREEKPAASQAEQTPKANTGPEFQGGNYALTSYIARHINYPPVAAEKKIQGKVVVKLTISSTGQVSNAEIVQSVDPMLDAEALRLCKSLPRFTPARRNGQPVASTMTIPINFRL